MTTHVGRLKISALHRYLPLLGLTLFGVALWVLHRELAHLHYHDVVRQLHALRVSALLLAAALTALSYLVLTGYDTLSLRYIGQSLAWWRAAFASFVGYAFSHNIGMAVFSGAPVRFRLYTVWGLSAVDIATLVAFNGLTFWLGMTTVAGLAFVLAGGAVPAGLDLPQAALRPVGVLCLTLAFGYVAACVLRRSPLRLGRWEVVPPRPRLAIAQLVVSSLDWSIAAAVLWVLLPAGSPVGFVHFLAVFMLAQGLGLISQIPGGLGVFETVVVLLLPSASTTAVLGSLLAYRLIYYLMPFAIAVGLFLAYELQAKRAQVGQVARAIGSGLEVLAPRVLAVTVFLGGAVLLISGATPAVSSRLHALSRIVPLPVLELSHFLGSIVGLGLLLLAWGLRRRLASAYWATLVLLVAGAALSLLKGFDWEEALVMVTMMAVLAPARRAFFRTTPLLNEPLSPAWLAAMAMVIIGSAWIGLFAYRHVDYSSELWWQVTLHGDAPRFLRAGLGVAIGLLVFGALRLLGPSAPRDHEPTPEELERVRAIAASSPNSSGNLALLGDKRFLISDSGSTFLMYAVSGRSWIAMGDAIGPATERADLAWRFHALADRHGGWTVFYEVGDDDLPVYLDLGLSLLKIGEEAVVPLKDFSLEGSDRKELRYILRRLERDGCSFEVIEPRGVAALLPQLREVSDAWLAEKSTREKGFSLGRFDQSYLVQLPLAVIRLDGEIVAFANLWPSAPGGELSVDLMRFRPSAPSGVMDFLFVHLLLWGRDQGFSAFALGMAPLAGLRSGPFASTWQRLASLVYRWGEHFYNFQGLRQYKEKFGPVWRSRYLVCPGGRAVPGVLADLASLISGSLLGTLRK